MHLSKILAIQITALLLCGVLFSSTIFAHEAASIETDIDGPESKILGVVELRPSYEAGTGNYFGENTVELGYQFSHKFQVTYSQEIHHNVHMVEANPEHEGLGLHLETGAIKAHIHEIWESSDGKSSLSLEPRLELPTSTEDRAKGFMTAGLIYAKFRRNLTDSVGLTFMEAPMLYAYSVPGATVGDEFEANPTFQNRMQVALDVSLFNNKLTLALPLQFYLTRHADFDSESLHNNTWTTFVGLAPELGFEFDSGMSAGIAVVTPNLIDSQLADHSVNHGRTSLLSQVFMRATL